MNQFFSITFQPLAQCSHLTTLSIQLYNPSTGLLELLFLNHLIDPIT